MDIYGIIIIHSALYMVLYIVTHLWAFLRNTL